MGLIIWTQNIRFGLRIWTQYTRFGSKNMEYGICEMWWLVGSAPDFWGRGPGFESGISHNDPGALQDHCVILYILRVEGEPPPGAKKIYKKRIWTQYMGLGSKNMDAVHGSRV